MSDENSKLLLIAVARLLLRLSLASKDEIIAWNYRNEIEAVENLLEGITKKS